MGGGFRQYWASESEAHDVDAYHRQLHTPAVRVLLSVAWHVKRGIVQTAPHHHAGGFEDDGAFFAGRGSYKNTRRGFPGRNQSMDAQTRAHFVQTLDPTLR